MIWSQIDLGKLSFHLHGVSSDGIVLSRKVSRAKLFAVVTELAPAIIAMEACPSAHYWGRRFQEAGRHVRLIHPRFVKPFVRGAKNDAIDAEAIWTPPITGFSLRDDSCTGQRR